MASNVTRRPRAQAQQNLQSTQTAHRQRLAQAAGSRPAAVPPRPPQLPSSSSGGEARGPSRGGYPDPPDAAEQQLWRSLGYAAAPRSPLGGSAGGPSSPHDASPRVSSRKSSGRSSPSARALSSPHGGARKSPHARSSRSASPQHALVRRHSEPDDAEPLDDGSEAGNAAADSDDGFEDDLEELALLCSHLNNHGESGLGVPADEHRPATGGTSASASTTAPGGSSGGEGRLNDVDELVGEGALDSAAVGDAFEELRGAQRAQWELQKFALPHGCRIERTDCSSAQFFFTMDVVEGPYTPATLVFWIKVFEEFPDPGSFSVRCTRRIFHPNVDPELGHLVLDHYNPAGDPNTMRAMLLAIRTLVCAPTESPALNRDAVKLLQSDVDEFRRTVRSTLSGLEHRGREYDQLLNVGKQPGRKTLAKAKAAAAAPLRSAAASHVFKVDMMELETMADHMKMMTQHWQDLNSLEIQSVENLLEAQRLEESCKEAPEDS